MLYGLVWWGKHEKPRDMNMKSILFPRGAKCWFIEEAWRGWREIRIFFPTNNLEENVFKRSFDIGLYSPGKSLPLPKQNKLNQINHQIFPNLCWKILRLVIPGHRSSQDKYQCSKTLSADLWGFHTTPTSTYKAELCQPALPTKFNASTRGRALKRNHQRARRRRVRAGIRAPPRGCGLETAALGPASALYGRAGCVLSSAERRPEAAA